MRRGLNMGPSRCIYLAVLLISAPVAAAPIDIEANLAAAPPRSDNATGVCGTAVHLSNGDLLVTQDAAEGFLNTPTDPLVNGTMKVGPYPAVNFRNSLPESTGDFTGQGTSEAAFPFSATDAM